MDQYLRNKIVSKSKIHKAAMKQKLKCYFLLTLVGTLFRDWYLFNEITTVFRDWIFK